MVMMMQKVKSSRHAMFLLAGALAVQSPTSGKAQSPRSITIDDVLNTRRLDQATISPDGKLLSLVMQRPAGPGEIYGRNAYEVDPSRSDVILVDLIGGSFKPLTDGHKSASGYWCTAWSPDGRKLAMLSTQSAQGERAGGNNVRLYVWNRDSGKLSRVINDGLLTQMRYGGPFQRLDLRGGPNASNQTHSCSGTDENAPYLWLSDNTLLVATLRPGDTSALLDRYARPARSIADDAQKIRDGTLPTASAVGSGIYREQDKKWTSTAILKRVNLDGSSSEIAQIPDYPFAGSLTVSVSPNLKRIAVLTSTGALPPKEGRLIENEIDSSWAVKNVLGFVNLDGVRQMRWQSSEKDGKLPLAIYDWSPDSRKLIVRGRSDEFSNKTSLFVIDENNASSVQVTIPTAEPHAWGTEGVANRPIIWVNKSSLLTRIPDVDDQTRNGWWIISTDGKRQSKLPISNMSNPVQMQNGDIYFQSKSGIYFLNRKSFDLTNVSGIQRDEKLCQLQDLRTSTDGLFVCASKDGMDTIRLWTPAHPAGGEGVDIDGDVVAVHGSTQSVITNHTAVNGGTVESINLRRSTATAAYRYNDQFKDIKLGKRELFEYKGAAGNTSKAAVIFPPDYVSGKRYPALFWVYQGYNTRSLDDYFLDPMMPGIYNMYLYAAQGYMVIIPSIPLKLGIDQTTQYLEIAKNVVPAIDKAAALGLIDPERVGVFGQSRGGYTVEAIVGQTNRFKAAVAMAGISDLSTWSGEFDSMARGYPGIEHEKGINFSQLPQFGLTIGSYKSPEAYNKISPLYYAGQVTTPIMLIHGTLDMRDSVVQSELFFNALYRQGKDAQLVRYGEESHSLAQSPANVRDIFDRIIKWFDFYLKN